MVYSADDDAEPDTPLGEGGRVAVDGAPGWFFEPIEPGQGGEEGRRVSLVREDGARAEMVLPGFVEQGDELSEIARLVIRARERWSKLKGLGA
jgi:hypothetical protein